ncbi:gephyrin-like molybdotransferase Glp [Gilvibacter sediminis]|uniref:molybdopterin molybdotransferase MoeA n=1 Tax=Gilvibacter sediminis TaxID=379071 RepID=UPI002350AF9A|nr:gephyrin-like molybdotransferase Glp [Gilvibacter sediminis]MDC7996931.1 molybdopterin molybdotransferase MoeA [Gilvibacter sediminis]
MVTVSEAIQLITNNVKSSAKMEQRTLSSALDNVLAADVVSPISMPPFRQSAMDGYAICSHDSMEYTVVGEVAAGSQDHPHLNRGEAVRIFTGAAVPDTADRIVIQEKVNRQEDHILLEEAFRLGANIRPIGEQLHKGDPVMGAGMRITPAGIGLLAGVGVAEVTVATKPRVAIVVTGDELKAAGEPLNRGQIYESNGAMLAAVLSDKGYNDSQVLKAEDDLEVLTNTLQQALTEADVVLVSGGISVGDYDFVKTALNNLGVQQVFYKVKQKPGKPLLFGKKEQKLVFALPGNPASALSCFYVYVLLALRLWEGDKQASSRFQFAKIESNYHKKGDRAQFLKAKKGADNTVAILDGQASSMLQSFAAADALVFLDEEVSYVDQESLVPYLNIL